LQVVENQLNNIFGNNVTPLLIMHLEQFLGERNALGITTAPVKNEIKLKILCTCFEEKDCSRLRVMNTVFLSVKVADKYLSSMASEGLINYNNETKRYEITSQGSITLKNSHPRKSSDN
jgi:predicted transcriptional regulator